jgi:hypothetical protein
MPMWDERELERPGQVKDRADERDEPPVDGAPTTAQMLPVVTDDLAQVPAYGGDASTEQVSIGSETAPGTAPGDAQAEAKDSNGVSATSLVAGAAAAATSSVIGGQLGVAGTVLGAGLASVVTAVAVTFYSRGLDKGKEKVQKAVAKIGPVPNAKDSRESPPESTDEPLTWRHKLRRKRVLYPVVIGAVTFVVGIGAVVVAEQVTVNDISPGTSQISRSLSGGTESADTYEDSGTSGDSAGADSGQQRSDDQQGTGEQGSRTDDGADSAGTAGDGSDSQLSTDEQGTDDQGTGGQESGDQGGSDQGTGQDSDSNSGQDSGQGSGSGGSTGSGSSGSGSSEGGSSGSGSSGGGSDANSQGDSGSGAESDSGGSVEAQAG